MKIVTVAINQQYHKEVQRLIRSLPNQNIEVIDENHSHYLNKSNDPLINGLYHKSNFANYLDESETTTPILFIDADAFTLTQNPFENFSVSTNSDIAYVPYEGTWHLPDEIRQNAVNYHGHKINSGFIWLKDLATAKRVCNQWSFEYLERKKLYDVSNGITKYEYDEWALMIALSKLNLNVELLDKKWNDWELNKEHEILNSNSIFFQSHDFLNIV